jgi:NhaP-type Na+/H+ or K+/H+ antiporter
VIVKSGQHGRSVMSEHKSKRRRLLLGVLFWVLFGAGLLLQALAPRLKIQDNAFVIPPALVSEGNEIRLEEIITKQRRMQWLSGVLTVSGAVGLAFYYYRHLLARQDQRGSMSVFL